MPAPALSPTSFKLPRLPDSCSFKIGDNIDPMRRNIDPTCKIVCIDGQASSPHTFELELISVSTSAMGKGLRQGQRIFLERCNSDLLTWSSVNYGCIVKEVDGRLVFCLSEKIDGK